MMISFPYKVLVGTEVEGKIGKMLDSMNLGKRCTIVSSEEIMEKVGRIKDAVSEKYEVDIVFLKDIDKTQLGNVAKSLQTDFIIGIGGGRAIDIAKYLAYLGKKQWIACPTILSHDGVLSSRAVVEEHGKKISVTAAEPSGVIADLGIIKNAPYRYIAAGAGDLLSNISSVEDWKIAAKHGKEGYHTTIGKLAMLSAEAIMDHVDEIKERTIHGLEILFWSLMCSGFAMNIYGSSRPCSGSEHNFSHALDMLGAGGMHGEQVAVGAIVSCYLQGGDWMKLKEIIKDFGIPMTAEGLFIEKEKIINALVEAKHVRDRFTVLNTIDISKEKAEKILKDVGVI